MSDLDKYLKNYNLSAASTKSTAKSSSVTSMDELLEELDKIDKEYEDTINSSITAEIDKLPDLPKYDYIEYEAPTDEQIKQTAEDSLSDYLQTGKDNIEKESAAAKADKEAEKLSAAQAAEENEKTIISNYDAAGKAVSDDTLKRGLARSSIAVNKTAEVQNSKASALNAAASQAAAEQSRLDTEIAALEQERVKALNAFNITYAAKVTEKISELTEARDKKVQEVLEYNNKLKEQENQDAEDRAELISDLKQQAYENNDLSGDSAEALGYMYQSKYNVIRSYLSGLSKTGASDALLKDDTIRNSLTDYYFYKLYNEFCR